MERRRRASDRRGQLSIYWQAADGSGPAEQLTTAEPGQWHLPESFAPDGAYWCERCVVGAMGRASAGELSPRNNPGTFDWVHWGLRGARCGPCLRWLQSPLTGRRTRISDAKT